MSINLMIEKVLTTIREYQLIVRGERIVCGVSGGADSVAMLHALCMLQERLDFTVSAAHLNHGLRGTESDRDASFVNMLCERLNVPLYEEKIHLDHEIGGLEARARDARYAFFSRASQYFKAYKIATAHTADDNLETVLFHLTRGCGLSGLRGIPLQRDGIIRPMLEVTREEIEVYLTQNHCSWVQDSSNDSDDYTRNVIRHKVVPELRKIHPRAVENSARTIRLIRSDEDSLERAAHEWLEKQNGDYLPIQVLELPEAVATRAIRQYAKKVSKNQKQDLEFQHICAIINLIRQTQPTGSVSLPGEICVCRAQDRLYFIKKQELLPLSPITLSAGESVTIRGYTITCHEGTILVRSRHEGDRIKLPGRPGKTLKKLFNELKIPQHLRALIPVIIRDGQVIAICGVGFAENKGTGGIQIEEHA